MADLPRSLVLPGLLACRACDLRKSCLRVVPGYGPNPSRVMIIAQSPGAEEDYIGKPFVGKSGDLLAKYMNLAGVPLDSVYRTNINKCRPPGNRKTTPGEKKACRHWLDDEIAQVNPDVILLLGDDAYKALIPDEDSSITQIRGNAYTRVIGGRPRFLLPTIHPAFAARNERTYGPWLLTDLKKGLALVGRATATPADVVPFRKTPATWDEILNAVQAPAFGFDLETDTGSGDEDEPGMRRARIIGVGVCSIPGNGCYYPFESDEEAAEKIPLLKQWLEDPNITKIVSNAKFERHILAGYGITLTSWEDTMMEAYVMGDFPLSLKDGFHHAFGIEMIRISTFSQRGYKQKHPITGKYGPDMRWAQDELLEEVCEYASQDPDASFRLHFYLLPQLKARGLEHIYRNIELPTTEIIVEMERWGFRFEPARLIEPTKEIKAELARAENMIEDLIGHKINVRSTPQVVAALYHEPHEYKIPPTVKHQRGETITEYPTDKIGLGLHSANPLVRAILLARAMRQLLSTFIEKLPLWVDANSRIHPEFNQAVAATGRLTAKNPNITQVPSRRRDDVQTSVDGASIRLGFRAADGFVLAAPDLSQIEMRVAAHLANDVAMIRELGPGGDIHSNSTTALTGKTKSEMDPRDWKNMRDLAKMIGFGSLYGLGADGILTRAPQLGLTREQAQYFIDLFYAAYPGLRQMQRDVVNFTRKNGYAETITGRRRYFPDITSTSVGFRNAAERGAMNHPIQGSAADYFKKALLDVKGAIVEAKSDIRMIAQVHDELVLEIPPEELDWAATTIPPLMANAIPLRVPVFVDFEIGETWGEMHKYEPKKAV